MGGHIALEIAPDLPKAREFIIFGTPPLAFPPAVGEAFLPNPAMPIGFMDRIEREQADAYVASFFRPEFWDIPPFFSGGRASDGRESTLECRGKYRARPIS